MGIIRDKKIEELQNIIESQERVISHCKDAMQAKDNTITQLKNENRILTKAVKIAYNKLSLDGEDGKVKKQKHKDVTRRSVNTSNTVISQEQ